MKKSILIAPRTHTREVALNADTERLLASGSWCVVSMPRKPNAVAIRQRVSRQRRQQAGCHRLSTMVSEGLFRKLTSLKREGETMADLFERLCESVTR